MLYFLAMNSIYGAIVLVVVLVLRFILRRAPKVFSYMLWAVVFFRLLCPLSLSTDISVIPDLSQIMNEKESCAEAEIADTGRAAEVTVHAESTLETEGQSESAAEDFPEYAGTEEKTEAGDAVSAESVIFILWASGCVLMLGRNMLTWIKMKKIVCTATRIDGRVYESDRIGTAFVSGIFRPRIYLPCGMEEQQYKCVLSHEMTHMRRGDHIVKLLACLICCVYWFNPLAWAALSLMCRDMEQSCDEAVIASMGSEIKGDYSRMLLRFGVKIPAASNPAFGAGDAKKRIKNVLRYRKSGKMAVILSLLAVVLAGAVCIGSHSSGNAKADEDKSAVSAYDIESTLDQEENTDNIRAVRREKEKLEANYTTRFGAPEAVMITELEIGSYAVFSYVADETLYVDMGDGDIVPGSEGGIVKGNTIKLYCNGNIRGLDLSNLKLTYLDISECTFLEKLYCHDNLLASLNVSMNRNLVELDCSGNRLTSLDLSGNPKLKYVCCDKNELAKLDCSSNSKLEHLYCAGNSLVSVSLGKCENLTSFACNNNMLSELSISGNSKLESLYCFNNMIAKLDVSQNPLLKTIESDFDTVIEK